MHFFNYCPFLNLQLFCLGGTAPKAPSRAWKHALAAGWSQTPKGLFHFISKYIFPYPFCFAPSFGNFCAKIGGSLKIQNHQKVSENEKLISVLDPKTVKSHKQQHQTVVGQILVPARGPSKFAGAGKKRVEKSVSSPVKAQRNLPLDGQHSGRGLFCLFSHSIK